MLCCLLPMGEVAAHEAEEVLLGGALRTVVEISFPDASTCIFTWWPCIHSFKGLWSPLIRFLDVLFNVNLFSFFVITFFSHIKTNSNICH